MPCALCGGSPEIWRLGVCVLKCFTAEYAEDSQGTPRKAVSKEASPLGSFLGGEVLAVSQLRSLDDIILTIAVR